MYYARPLRSVESPPGFWSTPTKFDPIFYVINGFRYGLLGTADAPIGLSFAVLFGLAVLFGGYAIYLIRTGLGLWQ